MRRSAFLQSVDYPAATRDSNERLNAVLVDLDEFIGCVRLDNNTIKSHTHTPAILGFSVEWVQNHVWPDAPSPGPAQLNRLEKEICKSMAQKSRTAKGAEICFLVESAVAAANAENWFMVFNTLTVKDGEYDAVFGNKDAWRDYIRKADRLFAQAAYGSIRAAKGKRYHDYLAVVEAGSTTGRLHIHVLHLFSHLPPGFDDPNTGLAVPYRREIAALKGLWPHGNSAPIAVRYNITDAYGLAGWRWPFDRKTQKGLKANAPLAVARYVAKYVTKSTNSNSGGYAWRVKKSQTLGRMILERLVQETTTTTLTTISSNPLLTLRLGRKKVPGSLLRMLSLREIQNRSSMIDLFTLGMDAEPQPSLLQRSRALTHGNANPKWQNSGTTVPEHTRTKDISDALRELSALEQKYNGLYYEASSTTPRAIETRP